jgi:hypothetical protein
MAQGSVMSGFYNQRVFVDIIETTSNAQSASKPLSAYPWVIAVAWV